MKLLIRHLGSAYVYMCYTRGPCDGLYVDVFVLRMVVINVLNFWPLETPNHIIYDLIRIN
uniref:Uncharacterized protein n=1 Tax=Magallana gigas TaxID=29159 RepID=K1RJR8_MAGGI